jgi:signal transduction histidine kinase
MKSHNSYWFVIFIGLAFIAFNFWYKYHLNNEPLPPLENILYWVIIFALAAVCAAFVFIYNRRIQNQKKYYEEYIKNTEYANELNWKQIAGDLHDSLGQNLLVVNSEIKQLEKSSLNGTAEKLKELSDILINSVDEIRRISSGLHPYHLERFGLKKAIETMINNMAKTSGIAFAISIDPIDNIFQKYAEYSIYRIIQESINNIIKHSKAKKVIIEIYTDKMYLNIKINDDGEGFDCKTVNSGLGLLNMEQRINNLSGTLKVNSGINEGTAILVTIPTKNISINSN